MHPKPKIIMLIVLTIIVVMITFLLSPIHQNQSYHSFADKRIIAGISNFWNVVTNLPFVLVGIYGLMLLRKTNDFRLIYTIMFIGILLTGFGSAYYHLHPDDNTLIYDRIPMTIVFMSFLSLTIAECISEHWGRRLLFALVLIGIISVLWWHYTNDLRWYGLVQFYPMLFVPMIYLLFPSGNSKQPWRIIQWVIVWYAIAKVCEHFDKEIFQRIQFISGHSLKHVFAATATYNLGRKVRNGYAKSAKNKASRS